MKKRYLIYILILNCQLIFSQNQDLQPVKIMHYNLLNYGNNCNVDLDEKDEWLRTILDHVGPDILTVNEIGNRELYADRIRNNGFPQNSQMVVGEFYVNEGSGITNAILYNAAKFDLVNRTIIEDWPRDITIYSLAPLGNPASSNPLHLIIAHFKAGRDDEDIATRQISGSKVMTWIEQNAQGENVLLLGDLNISRASEPGFRLLVDNSNPSIDLIDPTGFDDGWGPDTRGVLTQSTRFSQPSDCGVGGGLDDRFDFMLLSESLLNGSGGATYIEGSFETIGNDAQVFNRALNCDLNTAVPQNVCESLFNTSDHLPIALEIGFTTTRKAELSGIKLQIPNPIKDQVQITISQNYTNSKLLTFRLYNAHGQLIFSKSISPNDNPSVSFPLQSQSPGTYFLRVSNDQGKYLYKKLLKES